MNDTHKQVALALKAAKPEKHAYANAVMESQTCPFSCKVDASTWAEWAAYDEWMVTVTKVAWSFFYNNATKNINSTEYEAFLKLAGYPG